MRLEGVTNLADRLAIMREHRAQTRAKHLGKITPRMEAARIALEAGPMRRIAGTTEFQGADGSTFQATILTALARRNMARVSGDEACAP